MVNKAGQLMAEWSWVPFPLSTDFFHSPLARKLQAHERLVQVGHGGGASGRTVAFCPSKLGSNPGTNLVFFGLERLYSCRALSFF